MACHLDSPDMIRNNSYCFFCMSPWDHGAKNQMQAENQCYIFCYVGIISLSFIRLTSGHFHADFNDRHNIQSKPILDSFRTSFRQHFLSFSNLCSFSEKFSYTSFYVFIRKILIANLYIIIEKAWKPVNP